MHVERPGRARTAWILALIVALALGLRLASLDRLLPEHREPDAFEVYEMQRVQADPALVKGVNFHERYPWLLAWTLAALPVAHAPADVASEQAEAEHLARAARPFVLVRGAVALLSTLQVLLVYFLARRFVGEGRALVASLLVATSLLQLLFAVQARPHGAHAGIALLALLAALQLSERFSWARLALSALSSAAALATLQLGFSTLPPLALACWLSRGAGRARRLGLALAAPLAAALLALAWYTNRPYVDAQGIHLARAEGGGHTLSFEQMDFLGTWRGARMLFEHDPVLSVLAAGGLLLLLARARPLWRAADEATRRASLVAAGFALPYLLVITIQGEVYERFLIPLLPFLAILAASAAGWIWRAKLARPLVGAALLLALVSSAQFVRLARAPDTWEQAAAFLREHSTPGQRIALFPDNALPLLYSPDSVRAQLEDRAQANVPWVTYQATIPALAPGTRTYEVTSFPAPIALRAKEPDVALMRRWLAEERVDWLVVEFSRRMWRAPLLPSLEEAARAEGELCFTTHGSAEHELELGPAEYQAIERFFARQLAQDALGPQLRVWRITRR